MIVDQLVKNPGSWLSMDRHTGVAVSSRIRLARNLDGAAFPTWAGEDERVRVCGRLKDALARVPAMQQAIFLDMGAASEVDKEVLRERHLISTDLAERGTGSAVVVSPDEQLSIMINEEDHLRLQALSPGLSLPRIWERINAADSQLEECVNYAFSPKLGYLTACPTNVGTGLRASVMVHLPGLRLLNEVDAAVKGLTRIGLEVRGLLGEGTEAVGNMFQISNRATLGASEESIVQRLMDITEEVVRLERNACARLIEERERHVWDHVGRAYGILINAHVLGSRESVELLSALRLGRDFGIVEGISQARINEVMLLTQPGHLQKITGRDLDPEERDSVRAEEVRRRLKGLRLASTGAG